MQSNNYWGSPGFSARVILLQPGGEPLQADAAAGQRSEKHLGKHRVRHKKAGSFLQLPASGDQKALCFRALQKQKCRDGCDSHKHPDQHGGAACWSGLCRPIDSRLGRLLRRGFGLFRL